MKLHQYAESIGIDAGCGDNSCVWGSPGGMATNGGCRCIDKEYDVQSLRRECRKLARVAMLLLDERKKNGR